jgi:hypothetical protein
MDLVTVDVRLVGRPGVRAFAENSTMSRLFPL